MSRGFLGLDIADKKIRYVFAEKRVGKVRILKAGKMDHDFDPSAAGALFSAVNSILAKESLFPQKIFVSLSLKDILVHQLMLPTLKGEELTEVISTEIEKIPVFASEKYDYIYKSYSTEREKQRIVYSVVQRKTLDYITGELNKVQSIFSDVEMTPLNLKDILSYMSSSTGSQAYLVVHDYQTYLGIAEKGNYRLLYKLPMGINQFTSGGNLGEVQEAYLLNWLAELRRVLKSFMLENKSTRVLTLWLSWDKDAMPNLDTRIEEALSIKVEPMTLNKIRILEVQENYPINSIYALAVVPMLCSALNIKTHFPSEYFTQNIRLKEYITKMVVSCLVIVGLVGVILGGLSIGIHQKKKLIMAQKAVIEKETADLRNDATFLYQKQSEYLEMKARLLQQATYVQFLNRVSWAEVFAVVSEELPPELSLTLFKFSGKGSAEIKGEALNMEAVSELIRRIESSSILEGGKFDSLQEKKVENKRIFTFSILAQLKDEKKEVSKEENDQK